MIEVVAAVLLQNERVLLARRKPGKKLAGFWEFPGGKVEKGESFAQALQREMHEEFSLSVRVGARVGESIFSYDFGQIRLTAFWVSDFSGEILLSDHDQIEWVAPEDLEKFSLAPADVPFVEEIRRFIRGR